MNSNELTGLCMTCNHAESCAYLTNAISSVWTCEEFDDRPACTTLEGDIRKTQSQPAIETVSEAVKYAKTA